MGFRWLVNAGLIAIPIGTTVGVLMGIDSHRSATGQTPLFTGDGGSDYGGGSGSGSGSGSPSPKPGDNGITETQYCQKELAISPPSKGVQYTLNPNPWGWTPGDPGTLCMNVTAFNNHTYPTDTTAPEFTVIWQYPPGPVSQPVHAFPHIQADSGTPIQVQDIEHINLDMHWTYGVGTKEAVSTNLQDLTLNLVNANVAMDMFLDSDKKTSQNASKAEYEVMIWFASFGAAAQPIGLDKGIVSTHVLNGTTFNLYTGTNALQQTVLTWYAAETVEAFTGDIAPLLTQLSSIANINSPAGSSYLGSLGLGSETFSSNVNVTFSVPSLSIDIQS